MVMLVLTPLQALVHPSVCRATSLAMILVGILTGCSGQTGRTTEDKREAFRKADSTVAVAARSGTTALCSLLHEPTFIKRATAASELGSMELDAAVAMENTWRAGHMPEHPHGPRALECLISVANDTSRSVRASAATAIGNFPGIRSSDALKEQLLREPDPEVRKRLLTAIGSVYVKENAAFLTAQALPTLADSMGLVLGAKNMAVADLAVAELIARCMGFDEHPALHMLVLDLLARTDTATLVGQRDALLAMARSPRSRSNEAEWCRVFARIPGAEAEAFLSEVLEHGRTPQARETARAAIVARRQKGIAGK